jgi:hypothetical protein
MRPGLEKSQFRLYCFVKRLTSFGTKLARNVKKGKEEKRDGEREERG